MKTFLVGIISAVFISVILILSIPHIAVGFGTDISTMTYVLCGIIAVSFSIHVFNEIWNLPIEQWKRIIIIIVSTPLYFLIPFWGIYVSMKSKRNYHWFWVIPGLAIGLQTLFFYFRKAEIWSVYSNEWTTVSYWRLDSDELYDVLNNRDRNYEEWNNKCQQKRDEIMSTLERLDFGVNSFVDAFNELNSNNYSYYDYTTAKISFTNYYAEYKEKRQRCINHLSDNEFKKAENDLDRLISLSSKIEMAYAKIKSREL